MKREREEAGDRIQGSHARGANDFGREWIGKESDRDGRGQGTGGPKLGSGHIFRALNLEILKS